MKQSEEMKKYCMYVLKQNALNRYIAAYINEELDRGNLITAQTIADAIEAFEGGAE